MKSNDWPVTGQKHTIHFSRGRGAATSRILSNEASVMGHKISHTFNGPLPSPAPVVFCYVVTISVITDGRRAAGQPTGTVLMDLTTAAGLLAMVSPLLISSGLLVIVLRSRGGLTDHARATPEISKARVLVNISAATGALAFTLVLALVVADRAGSEILAPVGVFAGILSIPSLLWQTKWRQRATDVTGLASAVMVIPFMSFWPIVVSLVGLLLVAGSLLRSGSARLRH